jgi:ubiquinone/menaquinone biosynthesis C-methylase UbiE
VLRQDYRREGRAGFPQERLWEISVGWYAQIVIPRLCDLFLNKPFVARYRRELLAQAMGDVLEIGLGTGLNLPHYPPRVRLTVIDPNPGMHRLAERRIHEIGIQVNRQVASAEQLPFEDGSFDCVVSTFTLCSITDVCRSLGEINRVLRSGGNFLFLEHGLSRDPKVQKWQHRLNWLQMRMANGCRLDRDMRALVAQVSFKSIEMNEFYLEKTPKTHGYMYQGVATK